MLRRPLLGGLVAALAAWNSLVMSAEGPSGQIIARLLEGRPAKSFVRVEAVPLRGLTSHWHVTADSRALAWKALGLCRAVRVDAVLVQERGQSRQWRVLEQETLNAVAFPNEDGCDRVPLDRFWPVAADVEMTNIKKLLQSIRQIDPCSRRVPNCSLRLEGIPWATLDLYADARTPSRVTRIGLESNLSTKDRQVYVVDFASNADGSAFRALVHLGKGKPTLVELSVAVP